MLTQVKGKDRGEKIFELIGTAETTDISPERLLEEI